MSLVAKTGARLMRSRTLMRAPIWIYRARAGAVFGSRMLMLEHIGRKSGTPRNAVLEVVDHPAPDTYVIASGFGKNSQWYRNILANPRVRVYVGSHRAAPATARVLEQAEADQALASYRSHHPAAWENLKQVIEETLGSPITDTDTALPMVELRLD
ncbi:hypothetical protein NJB1507_41480 [Mycobacterium marinum]|uniref:nitroreductase family deazaflavin-dependent oxidoreductase n=1 Tax=Mycobacterium marinum TaxID=1781 RepID=UPI0021C2AF2E|nr:nitroreductase family deazaflavin-dependent oxidoreductase [Mycobacterium marinum]GJO31890.1 hypothetical protein NJB1507_41480 [Mycobacterium marinum]